MLLIGNGRLITRSQTNPYLEDGAVVEAAPSKEFFEHPRQERTRAFLRTVSQGHGVPPTNEKEHLP